MILRALLPRFVRSARARVLLPAGLALALVNGAQAQADVPPATPGIVVDLNTGLAGNYLAARVAGSDKDLAAAALFFSAALDEDPGNEFLVERAFTLLIAAGKVDAALALAGRAAAFDGASRIVSLAVGSNEIAQSKYGAAIRELTVARSGPLGTLTAGLLTAWALAGEGKTDQALAEIDSLKGADWYEPFKAHHAALIADYAGRTAEAKRRFDIAYQADTSNLRLIDAYARVLVRSGERARAEEIIGRYAPLGEDHPLVIQLRSAIADPKPKPLVTTPQGGASEVLYSLGTAIGREGNEELGAAYLQLARRLDPKSDIALVSLATLFEQMGQNREAVEVFELVPKDSTLYRSSQIQVGLNLNAMDDLDGARKHLEAMVAADPSDLEAVVALGNVYRSHKMFTEAAATYDRGIQSLKEPSSRDWTLYYFRGIARERTKQWPAAEADFRKALTLVPDQPLVLNYLGYSLIDMGENLDEGLTMVQKAVELRPDDGYIVDSLGWAYFQLGRYPEAVVELEKAVSLKPADPVINDHLGDAYWKVGRRLEAKFQWNHARDLKPEPEDLPKILSKIQNGLDGSQTPAAGGESAAAPVQVPAGEASKVQ